MNFVGKCVYLGSNSFVSKNNSQTYYLVKLHLPNGDIHDFFVDKKVYELINLNLYDNVSVSFELSSFNRTIQVSVLDIKKAS